jgi:hypothetical protein
MDGAVEKQGRWPKPETADNRKEDCVISAATGLSHGVGLQPTFILSSCPYLATVEVQIMFKLGCDDHISTGQ